MTKLILYAKIIFMNIIRNGKIKFVLILILVSTLCFCGIEIFSMRSAYADVQAETSLFLPKTEMEYKELVSPIAAYSDDTVTAYIENNSNDVKRITIYNGNVVSTLSYSDANFSDLAANPTGIKRLNDSTLLYSGSGRIYKINLNNPNEWNEITLKPNIGATRFDLNGKFLVSAHATNMALYLLNDACTEATTLTSKTIKEDYPTAINGKGQVFYVNNSGIQKILIEDGNTVTAPTQIATNVFPSHLIANDDYLFYLEYNEIYRLSVNGGEPERLYVKGDKKHDLGNLKIASGISFKGENLLVTDIELNAIQEFKIVGNELIFTGFAIASGKTAYNRIGATASNVERYGDIVAVLDNHKFTVINASENFDAYNSNCFSSYFKEDFGGVMPSGFALGKDKALFFVNDNSTTTSPDTLLLLDLTKPVCLDQTENRNPITVNTALPFSTIRDVCYQSGIYYVLSADANASTVFSASENDLTKMKEVKNVSFPNSQCDGVIVDVYQNIYISNSNTQVLTSYKRSNENGQINYTASANIATPEKIKKFATDLSGTIYGLAKNKLVYYDSLSQEWQEVSSSFLNNASSFAMNFDKKEVYVIEDGKETIRKTTNLKNLAIDALSVSKNDYKTTDGNADLSKFKTYKPNDYVNVYSINVNGDDTLKFNQLIEDRNEYAYVCTIEQQSISFYVMVGQNETVLVDSSLLQDVTPTADSNVPQKAFLITDVHGYYYPIITAKGEYVITTPDALRLEKHSEIIPEAKFTFLEKEFYYASVTVNGNFHKVYIPTDFTVEVLSKDFVFDTHTVKKLASTTLYKNADLTEEVQSIADGTLVKVLSETNGILYIALEDNGGYILGYVRASTIINDSNLAIRNILIVLAVTACVCGTTTYFILRKKS